MTHTFGPDSYAPFVAEWLSKPGLHDLVPTKPPRHSSDGPTLETVFQRRPIVDYDMARACLAGLWLYRDYLHESHELSQEIETTTGSYWHGIMHRREPDYGNAKYWFRRVGRHPVFKRLGLEAKKLADATGNDPATEFLRSASNWDPYQFVDLCEAVQTLHLNCRSLCLQIQRLEWELLFDYSYQQAI